MQYYTLFIAAFLAATFLPVSSEVLLAALMTEHYSLWGLWLAATAGNCLGSIFNAFLGRQCLRWQDRPWFPFKPHKLATAQGWFQRFGVYSLLFAWVPLLGDPLTFVAGMMRVKWMPFILLVSLGKGLRYAVVILLMKSALL